MTEEKTKKRLGRPRAFDTPEEMQERIEGYFNSISRTVAITELDSGGKKVSVLNDLGEPMERRAWLEPPTLADLNEYLGITRETWSQYAKKQDFSDSCTRAKQKIEGYLARKLSEGGNTRGIEFNLTNNFPDGWSNKRELELGDKTRESLDSANKSLAEKMQLLAEVSVICTEAGEIGGGGTN